MRLRFLDMDELRWMKVTYKKTGEAKTFDVSPQTDDAGTSADRVVEQQRVGHCRRKNTSTQQCPSWHPAETLQPLL